MTARRALFLDRDGVINVDRSYVHTVADFEFLPGVFDTARAARRLGLAVIVVTNQAGIGRGLYTIEQFKALTAWMSACFASEGAPLCDVYYCPYHADALPPYNIANHPDRKPNPGMLNRAARDHEIDLASSVLVGDQASDIEAGRAAGLARVALLGCARCETFDHLPDHAAAVTWLHRQVVVSGVV